MTNQSKFKRQLFLRGCKVNSWLLRVIKTPMGVLPQVFSEATVCGGNFVINKMYSIIEASFKPNSPTLPAILRAIQYLFDKHFCCYTSLFWKKG